LHYRFSEISLHCRYAYSSPSPVAGEWNGSEEGCKRKLPSRVFASFAKEPFASLLCLCFSPASPRDAFSLFRSHQRSLYHRFFEYNGISSSRLFVPFPPQLLFTHPRPPVSQAPRSRFEALCDTLTPAVSSSDHLPRCSETHSDDFAKSTVFLPPYVSSYPFHPNVLSLNLLPHVAHAQLPRLR